MDTENRRNKGSLTFTAVERSTAEHAEFAEFIYVGSACSAFSAVTGVIGEQRSGGVNGCAC
jgi:hypothetical protein